MLETPGKDGHGPDDEVRKLNELHAVRCAARRTQAAVAATDKGEVLASPFPRGLFLLFALNAFFVGLLALWRAVLYDFSAAGWTLVLGAGAAGCVLGLKLPDRFRGALVGSASLLVLLTPVILLALSGRFVVIPRVLTPPPLFFFSVLLAALAGWIAVRIRRREAAVQRRISAGSAPDATAASDLERYFREMSVLRERIISARKTFEANQKRLPRQPDERWDEAAAALRVYLEDARAYLADWEAIPLPAGLSSVRQASIEAAERYFAKLEEAAEEVERHEANPFRGALRELLREVEEADRDWLYALELAARRARVDRPKWLVQERRKLSKNPL